MPAVAASLPPFPAPTLREIRQTSPDFPIAFEGILEPVVVVADADQAAPITGRDIAGAQKTAAFHAESFEEFPGAVAVAAPRLAANPRWRRIVETNSSPSRDNACADTSIPSCAASVWERWHDLLREVAALSGEERLQAANEGVNALLAYASDDETYGVGDHWATLGESLARGRGDCEDIAIAKMWLLQAAGVDPSSMRMVVLRDTLRNLDHAVLTVIEDGHQYVLDNLSRKVGRADWMRGYRPIYALGVEQSWIYGVRVPVAPPLVVAQNAVPALPQ